MKKRIEVVFAILLFAVAGVFAETDYKIKAPKNGNVLVVGRVTTKKPIDIAGREPVFKKRSHVLKPEDYLDSDIIRFRVQNDFQLVPEFAEPHSKKEFSLEDGYFFTEIRPDGTGHLLLKDFDVCLFAKTNQYFRFALPGGFKIAVPGEAEYVYIGTFEYDLDYALRTVGFKHIDDYDSAKEIVEKALGEEIELYRGEVTVQ